MKCSFHRKMQVFRSGCTRGPALLRTPPEPPLAALRTPLYLGRARSARRASRDWATNSGAAGMGWLMGSTSSAAVPQRSNHQGWRSGPPQGPGRPCEPGRAGPPKSTGAAEKSAKGPPEGRCLAAPKGDDRDVGGPERSTKTEGGALSNGVTVQVPPTGILTPALARALLAVIANAKRSGAVEVDSAERGCRSDGLRS